MTITIVLITSLVLAIAAALIFGFVTKDWDISPFAFLAAFLICMLVGALIGGIIEVIFNESTVETFVVEAEVTHLDITESKGRSTPATTTYRVSVVGNNDFAAVFDVEPEVYARLKVGDTITIEVTSTNNTLLADEISYRIITN